MKKWIWIFIIVIWVGIIFLIGFGWGLRDSVKSIKKALENKIVCDPQKEVCYLNLKETITY